MKRSTNWKISPVFLLLLAAAAPAPAAPVSSAERDFQPKRAARAFPAIVDAPAIAADEAARKVLPNELVLGVVVGEEARAYPINIPGAYSGRFSWLRPAASPPSGVGPPRRYSPLYRLRRSSLSGVLSLGLEPTDHLPE